MKTVVEYIRAIVAVSILYGLLFVIGPIWTLLQDIAGFRSQGRYTYKWYMKTKYGREREQKGYKVSLLKFDDFMIYDYVDVIRESIVKIARSKR